MMPPRRDQVVPLHLCTCVGSTLPHFATIIPSTFKLRVVGRRGEGSRSEPDRLTPSRSTRRTLRLRLRRATSAEVDLRAHKQQQGHNHQAPLTHGRYCELRGARDPPVSVDVHVGKVVFAGTLIDAIRNAVHVRVDTVLVCVSAAADSRAQFRIVGAEIETARGRTVGGRRARLARKGHSDPVQDHDLRKR